MAAGAGRKNGGDHAHSLRVSFELFPPRTPNAERKFDATIDALARFGPRFLSLTSGAGGSNRGGTRDIVRRLLEEASAPIAAHLTCTGTSRASVDARARVYRELGVHHVVALRGDPPRGETRFRPHPDGYDCAASLVERLRAIADFDISVAGYPETHPEAASPRADLEYLKRKVDAGANRVITQVFFDNTDFLRFRDRATAIGIDVPIVPGILPIADFAKVTRFCRSCGAGIPAWLGRRFEGLEGNTDTGAMIGAAIAARQCMQLRAEGVDEFHFYTMNRPDPSRAVCRMLDLQPDCGPAEAASDAVTHMAATRSRPVRTTP